MGEQLPIVANLRNAANGFFPSHPLGDYGVCDEAADTIAALYEALVECREYVEGYEPYNSAIQADQLKSLAKLDAALSLALGESPNA